MIPPRRLGAPAGLVLAAALLLVPASPEAGTLRVPRDAMTLESALRRAADGDTVLVAPGIHHGPVRILRSVRIEAPAGPALTVLTGTGPGPVVTVDGGGPGAVLSGFTVRGGTTGIDLRHGVFQVWDCAVTGADSLGIRAGAGTYPRLFASTVSDCPVGVDLGPGADALVMRNTLRGCGVGIRVAASGARIFRNVFAADSVGVEILPGASAAVGGSPADGNDFLLPGSGEVALRNASADTVNASYNWWGSADCDTVRARLAGPVRFLPFTGAGHRRVIDACP